MNNKIDNSTKNVVLYKTELCRIFTIMGKCKYNDKCKFAHGNKELRFMLKNKNYKTEPCKNYIDDGYCQYNSRCIYIHENGERDVVQKLKIENNLTVDISTNDKGKNLVEILNNNLIEDQNSSYDIFCLSPKGELKELEEK